MVPLLGLAVGWACTDPSPPAPNIEPPPPNSEPPPPPVAPPPRPAPAAAPRVPTTQFRVATYNINFTTRDLATVVKLIDEMDADVVVLQELTPRARPYLAQHTKTRYPHAHLQPKGWAGGNAILSKTPLRQVTEIPPRHGPFGALMASVEIDGRTLQIASVHLKPTLPGKRTTKAQMMLSFLKNEQIRRAEIAQILATLDPEIPSILAGDFNTLPSLSVVGDLEALRFVDAQAHDSAHADDPTWHWVWRGTPLQLRIDYVFHSPEIQTQEVRVLARGPSDHYPVVATLRW